MMTYNQRITPNFDSRLNVVGATKEWLDLRREKFPEEVAKRLKYYRLSRGISEDEMANYFGMYTPQYKMLEDGKTHMTLDDLICLVNILPWNLNIRDRKPIQSITELEFVEEKK